MTKFNAYFGESPAEVYDLIFNLSIKTKFINIVIILVIINQKCRKK